MIRNQPVEVFEVERKFLVDEALSLPTREQLAAAGFTLHTEQPFQLTATYFDTPLLNLAANKMALRRRTGGKDNGWHLKFKHAEGARELMWPDQIDMPQSLREQLTEHLGAELANQIQPIASIATYRATHILIVSGEPVIELVDDRVEGANLLSQSTKQWREWETELIGSASPEVLDTLQSLLIDLGARHVTQTSKIQQTMQG